MTIVQFMQLKASQQCKAQADAATAQQDAMMKCGPNYNPQKYPDPKTNPDCIVQFCANSANAGNRICPSQGCAGAEANTNPVCICQKNPSNPTCLKVQSQGASSLASSLASLASSGKSAKDYGVDSGMGAGEDLGLNPNANNAAKASGAADGGGAKGGGLGDPGSGGGSVGGGGDGAPGKGPYDTNTIGGVGSANGGGSAFSTGGGGYGSGGYRGSSGSGGNGLGGLDLRAFLPGGTKDPRRNIASSKVVLQQAGVTEANGENNFLKVTRKMNELRQSGELLPEK